MDCNKKLFLSKWNRQNRSQSLPQKEDSDFDSDSNSVPKRGLRGLQLYTQLNDGKVLHITTAQ